MPRYKYQTNQGAIHQVRLSAAKFALAGAEPAGAVEELLWDVSVSTSKRSRTKLRARGVVYTREDPVGTTGRVSVQSVFIPKLLAASLIGVDPTITYKGKADWKASSVVNEG